MLTFVPSWALFLTLSLRLSEVPAKGKDKLWNFEMHRLLRKNPTELYQN